MEDYIVYADLTFLVNFIMDFCILWASGKLANLKLSYSRLMLAAILGGLYGVGYLFPSLAIGYYPPLKIAFSVLLIALGLYPPSLKKWKQVMLIFYGISFLAVGATLASSFLLTSNNSSRDFSYMWLLGGVFGVLLVGIYGSKFIQQKVIPSLLKFKVNIIFAGLACAGEGFLDTGNGLRDPLTNKPVLVAEYDLIKPCLPDDLIQVMDKPITEYKMLEELIYSSWANRLRLIPFTSIGRKNGLLLGIRADEIRIEQVDNPIMLKNVIIGVYLDKLSHEGHYQMLIPAEIIRSG